MVEKGESGRFGNRKPWEIRTIYKYMPKLGFESTALFSDICALKLAESENNFISALLSNVPGILVKSQEPVTVSFPAVG